MGQDASQGASMGASTRASKVTLTDIKWPVNPTIDQLSRLAESTTNFQPDGRFTMMDWEGKGAPRTSKARNRQEAIKTQSNSWASWLRTVEHRGGSGNVSSGAAESDGPNPRKARLNEALAPAAVAIAGSKAKEERSRMVPDKGPEEEEEDDDEEEEDEFQQAAREAAEVKALWLKVEKAQVKAREAAWVSGKLKKAAAQTGPRIGDTHQAETLEEEEEEEEEEEKEDNNDDHRGLSTTAYRIFFEQTLDLDADKGDSHHKRCQLFKRMVAALPKKDPSSDLPWRHEECATFKRALEVHDGDIRRIQANYLPNRGVDELEALYRLCKTWNSGPPKQDLSLCGAYKEFLTEIRRHRVPKRCKRCYYDPTKLVRCSANLCHKGYHVSCTDLTEPPAGEWYCAMCTGRAAVLTEIVASYEEVIAAGTGFAGNRLL